ncbi:hypothetical protein [Acinetobacter terrae]|uniref:Uncharacterized protein n=1 Tax=Acinetobacter terrae TaxID=2731247 RepID=A0A4R0EM30_9GAMM|nr:hypothetical protein [Acinetobacter terrae]TCB58765.1 hypothetical protein E0H85_09260 [Acinetobacter terrae]
MSKKESSALVFTRSIAYRLLAEYIPQDGAVLIKKGFLETLFKIKAYARFQRLSCRKIRQRMKKSPIFRGFFQIKAYEQHSCLSCVKKKAALSFLLRL